MFCLRSWLPLLVIPTNASPIFIFLFFICTYFLNRPCVYCSFLLLILFASSCHWSDHCFFDFNSNWFEPNGNPLPSNNTMAPVLNIYADALNRTAASFAGTMLEQTQRNLATKIEWTGVGVEWLRSLLGKREWRLPCMDVYIRLSKAEEEEEEEEEDKWYQVSWKKCCRQNLVCLTWAMRLRLLLDVDGWRGCC